jgi:hypothetical protein
MIQNPELYSVWKCNDPRFYHWLILGSSIQVFIDNVTKSQNQRKQKELGESAEMTECALKTLGLVRHVRPNGGSLLGFLRCF